MLNIQLTSTQCAICKTQSNAKEIYPANFDPGAFTPAIFSARRLPDKIHYRMVRCDSCGLVRSDPVVAPELLAGLYTRSTFDYADELENLRATYGHYLKKLMRHGVSKDALLEIGCGNGFFLEEALKQGFCTVCGVEPSWEAVHKAKPSIAPSLVCDVMKPGLFEPSSFDVVCMFQVFDHVPDPGSLLQECLRVLKPGGFVLCLNHNSEAISARLLREKSPIVDIEHTYLYGPATLRRIFALHGFQPVTTGSVVNIYSVRYFLRLMPIPTRLKGNLLALLERLPFGKARFVFPLGNLYLIARKPRNGDAASGDHHETL